MVSSDPHSRGMDDQTFIRARELLAANLDRWLKEGRTTFKRLVESETLSRGQVSRIRHAEISTGVDQIDQLAIGLDLEPWQLLHPVKEMAELTPPQRAAVESFARKLIQLPERELDRATMMAAYAVDTILMQQPEVPEPPPPPARGAALADRPLARPKTARQAD